MWLNWTEIKTSSLENQPRKLYAFGATDGMAEETNYSLKPIKGMQKLQKKL